MNVTIAIDSYKGCMSSLEAGNAARSGVLAVLPDANVEVFPIADGGEGTINALVHAFSNMKQSQAANCIEKRTTQVTGPLGHKITATYYIHGNTAYIEMAQAAGLALVPEEMRNPMNTTTAGVGEMISDAIDAGCRDFVIGIGGSAINDCGLGMLHALGFQFYDRRGNEIWKGAKALCEVVDIGYENARVELSNCHFKIACDVQNPLTGPNGCSYIFAPQKGATPEDIEKMDAAMNRFANIVEHVAECDMSSLVAGHDRNYPGTGAAGGLGFAFLMFTKATLIPGIEIVIRETGLEKSIERADLVITGEGKMDAQTFMGKTPFGIAKLAKKHHCTILGVGGSIDDSFWEDGNEYFDDCLAITDPSQPLSEAMKLENALENMKNKIVEYCQIKYNN